MKIITAFILSICSLKSVCQIKNVYFEYHIISLQYKTDTVIFDFPQVITIKEFGCTSITPLWGGKNEYGVKLELIKSNVGLKDELILSKCFYIKEASSWKEINKSASLQQNVIREHQNELGKERDWVRGSEGGGEEFRFSYMQLLYAY